tara:strand:+ start:372 stop:611 length:240 start_codon:yes stop_codon:yes gene_type:complete
VQSRNLPTLKTTEIAIWSLNSLVQGLSSAQTKSDVRQLISQHGREPVLQAWKSLAPIDKAALRLVHDFDGTIIHDSTDG